MSILHIGSSSYRWQLVEKWNKETVVNVSWEKLILV